ncbi:MAG: helix-turn-helix domain-containing protein [Ignavibacteriaceae bacterium]
MQNETILQKLNSIEKHFNQDEKPFTFIEASTYLNVSRSYLYKLTSTKQITHWKPNGKKIYFQKADLNKWLFRNKRESDSEIEQKAIDYIQEGGN